MKSKGWIWAALVALLAAVPLLSGCSQQTAAAASEPEPVEEVVVAEPEQAPTVNVTGRVVPSDWTVLSFTQNGTIVELLVEVGDRVEEGDVIARLGAAEMQVQLLQAQANLTEAQARLEKVEAGPSEEEINAAEQMVAAANARTAAAAARRDVLYSDNNQSEMAQAEADLFEAQLRHASALEDLQWLQGFKPEDCEAYESANQGYEVLAEDEIRRIYDDIEEYVDLPDLPDLDMILPQPASPQCPLGAYKQVEDYYNLTALELNAAQLYLDELNAGPDPNEVRLGNARVWMASAQAQAAQARLDYLLAQPFPEQVAVADAELEQSQKELQVIELQIEQVNLIAPFSGVVTDRYADQDEYVIPGQSIIQLATLDQLYIDTTDLTELDVTQVRMGSPATVTFDALDGVEVNGSVVGIAPKAEDGRGVTFTVTLDLDDVPEDLRWGMTAFVSIEATEPGGED